MLGPIALLRQNLCEHIDEVRTTLGRQMLLENPSTYLAFVESTWSEVDFIAEVVRRTGCGLLLDVNNVYVASTPCPAFTPAHGALAHAAR